MSVDTRPFRWAASGAEDWRQAVTDCVAGLGRDRMDADRLGFVYATDHFAAAMPAIVGALTERTGVDSWVGTVGIGIVAGPRAYYDEPGLTVMTAPIAERDFTLFDCVPPPAPADGGLPVAVVHADPRNAKIGDLLRDVAATSGAYCVGGLTAARGDRFDQVAGAVTDGGLSGVVLAPGIAVATGLTQGCAPLGPVRRITGAADNVLISIDDRPALDVLRGDLVAAGFDPANLRRMGGTVFAGFPVPRSDTGDYVVRNLVGIDPDQGLVVVAEKVGTHDSVLFCKRDRAAAEADLEFMARRVRARTDRVRGAIYVSCLARGPHGFGSADAEVALVQRALGDVPLVGFFANGEISHDRIYGYTGVLVMF